MSAWLWAANAKLWGTTSTLQPFEALRNYIEDPSRYVYWATPRYRNAIEQDDDAFIWLSGAGVVAMGKVQEAPATEGFQHRQRLHPTGWNEEDATSACKTGIAITKTFWNKPPAIKGLFDGPGTVFPVKEADLARIKDRIR